jgi:autotransporter-associated beta strand protein
MGTIVNSNGALALENNITVIGEVLTLSGGGFTTLQGTNLWDGPITINTNAHFNVVNAGTVLNVAGAISGAGSLYKDGTGKLGFVANLPNTYAGATIVTGGTLELSRTNVIAVPGPMIIGDILSPQKSHVVRLLTPDQIVDNAPVTINSSGWLDLNTPYGASDTVGSLAGSGFVSLGYNTLRAGGNNSDTTFAGIITGWGAPLSSFIKQGGGTMNLNGNSPNFLGSTVISGGILSINGSQPSSPVYVNPSGTLAGNGVTGLISSSKGKVTPGNSPGSLKTGAFTLDTSSTLELDLNGTNAGVTYDQVSVIGAVNLGGAILHPMLGFNSASTNKFVIIANDGNDPVVGTFHGLPEGATLTVGSAQFQITYQGGDGNDVVLNQLSAITPPSFTGLTKQGNGHMQLDGAGIAGFSYTVQASTNLATSNWVNIGSTLAGLNGVLNYIDTNAPNFSMRFYRLVVP